MIRRLPPFKGKQRLARFLFKNKISRSIDITVDGQYGCRYMIPNIKEGIGFEIFINGIYEKETIGFLIDKLPANGCMIDIGANIGSVIIPICKRRNDINAISIEASKRVFDYLENNIKQNNIANCILINKAISEVDGSSVSFYSPVELYGKGSMSPVFTEQAEVVSTITLDSLITDLTLPVIDLIKIDVEGYEYHAFKGGEKLLSAAGAPDILFEFADWTEGLAKDTEPGDAQALLIRYGYKLFNFDHAGKLTGLTAPVISGSTMIWASKKI